MARKMNFEAARLPACPRGKENGDVPMTQNFVVVLCLHVRACNSAARHMTLYRDRLKSMQVLISRTQAGQAVKQEQGEISRNHVQTF